jgi:hypothetical protein
LIDIPNGRKIHVLSLSTLVNRYEIGDDAVLKMDCEGCEYEVLFNVRDEFLLPFSQIMLEYHEGFADLARRLTEIGYNAQTLDVRGRPTTNPSDERGLIYARLKR